MKHESTSQPKNRLFKTYEAIDRVTGKVVKAECLPNMTVEFGEKALSGRFECPECGIRMTASHRRPNAKRSRAHFRSLEEHKPGCLARARSSQTSGQGDGSSRPLYDFPSVIRFAAVPSIDPNARMGAVPVAEGVLSETLAEDDRQGRTDGTIREACRCFATGVASAADPNAAPMSVKDRLVQPLVVPGCRGRKTYGDVFRHAHDRRGAELSSCYILYAEFLFKQPPRLVDGQLRFLLFQPWVKSGGSDAPVVCLDLSSWLESQREEFQKEIDAAVEQARMSFHKRERLRPWVFILGRFGTDLDQPIVPDPGHPASVAILSCEMPSELTRRTSECRPRPVPPEGPIWKPEPRNDALDRDEAPRIVPAGDDAQFSTQTKAEGPWDSLDRDATSPDAAADASDACSGTERESEPIRDGQNAGGAHLGDRSKAETDRDIQNRDGHHPQQTDEIWSDDSALAPPRERTMKGPIHSLLFSVASTASGWTARFKQWWRY